MRKTLLVVMAVLALPVAAFATPYDQILDQVQQTGFNYFWNEANPANGMIKDRSTPGSFCSIAAVGFGLTAICIGIDHGWITRAQGAARVQTTLNTFWTLPQGPASTGTIGYNGFFYHFLDMNTGLRLGTTELSDIDTALLLAGVLDCEQYFNSGSDPTEINIRSLADQIYRRVDWTFFRNASLKGLMIQWTPESGFNTGVWKGYNEMMIMYILAMGSPTHPIPGGSAGDWNTYISGYVYGTLYGQTYLQYGALFTHQYSHCWIDFRNKRDGFMTFKASDYFTNSRKATLAQQAYCIANPGLKQAEPPSFPVNYPDPAGYSATLWGLTAGDDPPPGDSYRAHGAPGPGTFDNGTIQPTAAVSSVCFASDICLPTIQNMYDNFPSLWGTYGFRDGFNLATNPDWYDTDYLGIDLGPEVIMIENYRNASIWLRFMQNPYVQAGMGPSGAQFVATVDVPSQPIASAARPEVWCGPNPFAAETAVHYAIPAAGTVRLTVHDVMGREVARLVDGWQPAGSRTVRFRGDGLANGVYWYRLSTPDGVVENKGVLMK
jgi:hypothetical protein